MPFVEQTEGYLFVWKDGKEEFISRNILNKSVFDAGKEGDQIVRFNGKERRTLYKYHEGRWYTCH